MILLQVCYLEGDQKLNVISLTKRNDFENTDAQREEKQVKRNIHIYKPQQPFFGKNCLLVALLQKKHKRKRKRNAARSRIKLKKLRMLLVTQT